METAPISMTVTVVTTEGRAQIGARHCGHCGRAVRETIHRRSSYSVDCFVLHTGETETGIVRRPDSDEIALVYRRLIRPVVVITCTDCYTDPDRRRRHQSWSCPADWQPCSPP